MFEVENVVLKLLPLLSRIQGDEQVQAFRKMAWDGLLGLIDLDALRMKDQPAASADLMRAVAEDPRLYDGSDCVVTHILLGALDDAGVARLSPAEICERSGFSTGVVRSSLRRLADAGYFRVIRPSQQQISAGHSGLGYEPRFVARLSHDETALAEASPS